MFGGSPWELMVVGLVALLLFGKRLPEVARSLGKGIVEFKRGVSGIETEIDTATYSEPTSRSLPDTQTEDESAPKFEPPPA